MCWYACGCYQSCSGHAAAQIRRQSGGAATWTGQHVGTAAGFSRASTTGWVLLAVAVAGISPQPGVLGVWVLAGEGGWSVVVLVLV